MHVAEVSSLLLKKIRKFQLMKVSSQKASYDGIDI